MSQSLTITLLDLTPSQLLDLNAAVEILLERFEAITEYDEKMEESDRREHKKLITCKETYLKFIEMECLAAEEQISKVCNITFSSTDKTYLASCLRIFQARLVATLKKLKLN